MAGDLSRKREEYDTQIVWTQEKRWGLAKARTWKVLSVGKAGDSVTSARGGMGNALN